MPKPHFHIVTMTKQNLALKQCNKQYCKVNVNNIVVNIKILFPL